MKLIDRWMVLFGLLYVSGVVSQTGFSQTVPVKIPDDKLARVGSEIIRASDLIDRIEFMPWIGKDLPHNLDSSKIKALQSIVAEKLLALEAAQRHIGEDENTMEIIKGIEEILSRDELFRREISDSVSVTKEELREGLQRYAWELRVVAYGMKSRDDAM